MSRAARLVRLGIFTLGFVVAALVEWATGMRATTALAVGILVVGFSWFAGTAAGYGWDDWTRHRRRIRRNKSEKGKR